MKLEGIFAPAVTPFKGEEVDEERLVEYLDFLIKGGIHGLFMLGTNGEGPLLTLEEKKKVIEGAVESASGRVPVVAGVGCVSTKESIELAKHAEKVGADAVHVVTPYYYPVSRQGLIRHYTRIAGSVELPVIIYHIPPLTGVKMSVETLMELAKVKNIAGIKDSSKDVAWFYNAITGLREKRPEFLFFGGSDALIYTHLSLGANGAVSAVANAFPEVVVELYEEFKKGNLKRAKELQDRVLMIRQAFKRCPYMAGVKAALRLRGIDAGEPRSPLVFLDEEGIERLEDELRSIGVL